MRNSPSKPVPFHLNSEFEKAYCFSIGMRAGDLVYIGGLTAADDDGNEIHANDAALQFKVIYERLDKVLAAHGGTAADVVSETIFYEIPDAEYNEHLFPIRQRYYAGLDGPSVAGVRVQGFTSDAIKVEVTAVAYLPQLTDR